MLSKFAKSRQATNRRLATGGVERTLHVQPRQEQRFVERGGTKRAYIKDVWYGADDDDFDADDFDEDIDAVRAAPTPSLEAAWGRTDADDDVAYGEVGYRAPPAQPPGYYEALRADLESDHVKNLVAKRRFKADTPTERLAEASTRARRAVIEAMAVRRSTQLLFSTDFAACIPSQLRAEFLATKEVNCILQVLATQLYSLLAAPRFGAIHCSHDAAVRELSSVGCRHLGSEALVMDGEPTAHMLPVDIRRFGGPAVVCGPHAHMNAERTQFTAVVLTFRIPNPNARGTVVEDTDVADPHGYRVRVVYVAVGDVTDATVESATLCFRTFQFSR